MSHRMYIANRCSTSPFPGLLMIATDATVAQKVLGLSGRFTRTGQGLMAAYARDKTASIPLSNRAPIGYETNRGQCIFDVTIESIALQTSLRRLHPSTDSLQFSQCQRQFLISLQGTNLTTMGKRSCVNLPTLGATSQVVAWRLRHLNCQ